MIYHKELTAPRYTVQLATIGDLRRAGSAGRRPLGRAGARPDCGTAGEAGHDDPAAGMGRTDAREHGRYPIASSWRHARCRLASGWHVGVRPARNAEGGRAVDQTGTRCVVRRLIGR